MKKKLLYLLPLLISFSLSFAQPANDNCTTAQNLGTLPAPANCPSGAGTAVTASGSITTATAANPYIYQNGCSGSGGPNMAVPANDVWYTFVASGYQAVITITSTFANPNVAMYAGNCASLGGGVGGCAVGSSGTVTLTVEQMVIGTTYYIQVSGNTGQTGTFNISVKNNKDCSDCLTSSTLTANPQPVNGTYQPGQTVTFCYHINSYSQINTNWLHGLQVSLGSGWNAATITPTTTPPPCQGTGQWLWQTSCTSSATGQTFGQGWYFDTTDPGSNAGDNFGDNCSGTISAANWNFCFSVTTNTACSAGSNLSVTINTSGDGESGSWSSLGCTDDPPSVFNAVGACCPPTMSSTASGCSGNTGTATATPVGGGGPFNYTWTGPSGYTNTTTGATGANTISNLAPGTYSVTITNAVNCAMTGTVTVGSSGTPPVAVANNGGPYCAGSTIALTSSGGGTYSWSGPNGFTSALQNPTIGTSTTAMSGVYTVTVTLSGCTATATTSVTVNPLPVPSANNGGPYCAGSTIALTSSGGGTYSWSGPNAFTSALQNPTIGTSTTAMSGIYTVTVTLNSCTATATTSVTVNPIPVPVANNGGPYCVGSTITLTSSGGGTYSWSGPNTFTSALQNPTIGTSTTAMSGIYTVTVTLSGCTATATTSVTVNPIPTPTATNGGPYCPTNTIQLNATGGGTYSWSGPNGFTSVVQNPTIPSATTAMSGVYTLTVTVSGCTAATTTSVTVNNNFTPVLSSNSPVCEGTTLNLFCSNGAVWSWTGPNSFSSNQQNPSIATVSPAATGTYSISVTDASGCSGTGTVSVVVNSLPIPSANNSGPYCEGGTISLTAAGGATYNWSGPAAFSSSTQNPGIASSTVAMSGVYTVTVTSAATCTAVATTTVTVNPIPVPSANNSGPYCVGATISLSSSGGTAYNWSGPNTFSSALQNPTIANATSAMAGIYSVTVTANGCTATTTTTVTINTAAIPALSSNSPVCEGGSLNLLCSNGSSWTWNGPNNFSSAIQNPVISPVTLASAGTYSISITDANGCIGTGTIPVVINPLPVITTTSDVICIGSTGTLTAAGATSYTWTPFTNPATGASVTASPATTTLYSVNGIDLNDCSSTSTATITVNPLPVITVNSATVCPGFSATLTAGGAISYSWSQGTTPSSGATVSVTPVATTQFTVTGTDANACVSSAVSTVTVNSALVIDAGNADTICIGNNIALNATGPAATYIWNPGNLNGPSQNITAASSITFTVNAVDANGCTGTDSVLITVPPQITLNTGGFPTSCFGSCDGQFVVLANPTTGPFANYTYLWSNGASAASSNTVCAGNYNVTVTDLAGCTATATVSITEPPAVTASVSGITPTSCNAVCDGAATINAGGGTGTYSYNWQPSGSGNSPANLCAGNYTCTVVDINSCSAQVTLTITEPTPLTLAIAPVGTICIGQSATLNATAGGGNGGYVFNWQGGTTPTNAATVTAAPTVTSVYTVSVTDANGCLPAVSSVTVAVNPSLSIVASADQIICAGSSVNMNASASGGNGIYTYTWAGGTTPLTGGNVSASPASTTTYSVTVTDGCGTPSATDSILITVNPLPTISITTSAPQGCAPWCVTFTANSNPSSALCNWNFSDNQTANGNCNPIICFNEPGSYGATLNVTDINGCSNTITNNNIVTVFPVPDADFSWSPNPATELNPVINYTDLSTGGNIVSWGWQFGDPNDNSSSAQNPVFTCDGAGMYDVTLVVTTDNGCVDSITQTVVIEPEFVIYVPNAFTPPGADGGDGINDDFFAKGVGIDTDNFEMWIYDRWGNMIFYTDDYFKHWDGKVQGKSDNLVQEDVYVWKIKLKTFRGEAKSYIGHVTVVK